MKPINHVSIVLLVLFSKKLTQSDISTHGGCPIPKRHADDGCLPPSDMSREIPQQELLATDLHGHQWPPKKEFAYQPLEYRPWTRSYEFITPIDQYLRSVQFNYCIGTRFQMSIEGEESWEQRALCTIVDIADVDHIRWPNSKWRCLKFNPCIDPTEVTKMKKPLTLHTQKRACPIDASSPEFSSLAMDGWYSAINMTTRIQCMFLLLLIIISSLPGMLRGSAKQKCQNSSRALQVQEESDTCANQSGALRQILLHFLPQHPGRTSMQQLMPKQQEIQIPICDPFYHYNRAANGHRYMLFGVNLANGSPELPSPQVLISSEAIRGRSTPSTSQSSVAKPSKCISSKKCNNCCSVGSRSCTKVLLLPFLKLLDVYSVYTRNVIKRGKDK
ncbi:hypothetical protein GQ457_02G035500 [Hibiscus cannabinus]